MTTFDADGAWEVLEQFGLSLQQCVRPREQARLAIEAVHDSLGADAVFWCSEEAGDGWEQTGTIPLTEEWCRDLLTRMQAEGGAQASTLLGSFLDPGSRPTAPWPCSAALVRLGKDGEDWLAALSFHPRRLFGPTDLRVMLLARRMLLGQRTWTERERGWRGSLDALTRDLRVTLDALLANVLRASRDADVLDQLWDCRQKLQALQAGEWPTRGASRVANSRSESATLNVMPPSIATVG